MRFLPDEACRIIDNRFDVITELIFHLRDIEDGDSHGDRYIQGRVGEILARADSISPEGGMSVSDGQRAISITLTCVQSRTLEFADQGALVYRP